ncbi:MAG: hypothetical protein ACOCRX_03135 [Candidatus Woesearchaeota archaeon]
MRKTITIANKYDKIINKIEEKFDSQEFDYLITNLIKTYVELKDKNIDIIIFAELIKDFDVDIFDLINYVLIMHKNPNRSKCMPLPNLQCYNMSNIPQNAQNPNNMKNNVAEQNNIDKNNQDEDNKEDNSLPILDMGIDLTG